MLSVDLVRHDVRGHDLELEGQLQAVADRLVEPVSHGGAVLAGKKQD